jgi:hypothetical protein
MKGKSSLAPELELELCVGRILEAVAGAGDQAVARPTANA